LAPQEPSLALCSRRELPASPRSLNVCKLPRKIRRAAKHRSRRARGSKHLERHQRGPQETVEERNAHANMKWWLENYFPSLTFQYIQTKDETQAIENIVRFINWGFPVLVAVSHINVEGHIILVTGYENYSGLWQAPSGTAQEVGRDRSAAEKKVSTILSGSK